MEAPQPFYHVRARNSCESPDPRAKRERMLVELSYRIRDYPTLPAHPDDSNEVWDAALAEDMAVELPQVHCSFRGCAWCGKLPILYRNASRRKHAYEVFIMKSLQRKQDAELQYHVMQFSGEQ